MPRELPEEEVWEMRLYTIQGAEFWTGSQTKGGILVDPRYIDADFFLKPYEWMREQMAKRLVSYSGDFPLWAWLARPDLRRISWKEKGHPFVLLTLEIPNERVLVSDYEAWHAVLNNWYLAADDADYKQRKRYPATPEEKRASWERIFDLGKPGPYSDGDQLQACIDRVYLHEVVHVRPFRSRGQSLAKL